MSSGMLRRSRLATTLAGTTALVALLVVGAASCVAGADDPRWGPFRGRFVDADTGEPIRGAVAYAVWLEIVPNPLHPTQKFYDVRLGVSDADGRFEIPEGRAPLVLPTRVEPPVFDYVAPRYEVVSAAKTETSNHLVRLRSWNRIAPRGTVPLTGLGNYSLIPHERWPELLDIINAVRTRMGLRPFQSLGGDL